MKSWINTEGEQDNIVLSSRVRLARNLEKTPFPDRLDVEEARKLINDIEGTFYSCEEFKEKFKTVYLWKQDNISNKAFLEKHLISPRLIKSAHKSAFIYNNEETVSLMLNEEDHIRLQCITAGLNLKEAYEEANNIDDKLEEKLKFAFHEKLGYLTTCPTNLGTAMRASVMIHLPALVMEKEINQIAGAISPLGMTIRGVYGEGSASEGALFQVSNQVTLGVSEEEILSNLIVLIKQIKDTEYLARERVMKKYKYELEDKIFRSLGVLKSAVLLNSYECLKLLSYVRMGVEMGIIRNVDKKALNSLLIEIQPSVMQKKSNMSLSRRERDINRANLVKEKLNKSEVGE